MSTTEITAPPQGGRVSSVLADPRRWDRDFFLLMVALLWLGILMGFVPEIIDRVRSCVQADCLRRRRPTIGENS